MEGCKFEKAEERSLAPPPSANSGQTCFVAFLVNHNTPHPPLFFVSAESKGLSDPVSSLDATLTRDFISVDSKEDSGQGTVGGGQRTRLNAF